jgi:thioredoxin 1
MSDKVLNVGEADFNAEVLQSAEPVLVDFWAEWCGPCRMIGPIVEEMADTYAGRLKVAKVNVDHNREIAARYGVRGIPTLLLIKDGQVQATQVGAVGKTQIAQMIETVL